MSYSTGIMNKRVAIMVRDTASDGDFGRNSAGRAYKYGTTVWTAYDFNRGTKSLREGALDGYDRVMFRMRWNSVVDRSSMLVYEGKTYQIESFNADKYQNTIQITAVEAPGKDLSGLIPGPTPEPEPTPTPDPEPASDDPDDLNNNETNNES